MRRAHHLPTVFFVASISLTGFLACCAATAQLTDATLDSPSLGKVSIHAHHTGKEPMWLTVDAADGKALAEIKFQIGGDGEGQHTNTRISVEPVEGVREPLIVAIAGEPGGSDSGFEIAVLGITDGKVTDLIQPHIRCNTRDPLFVTAAPKAEKGARVIALHCGMENTPLADSPQQYSARIFDWDGATLTEGKPLKTKACYKTWKDAATELGLKDCHVNLIRALLPDLM